MAHVVRGWQLVRVGALGRPHHRRAGDNELVSRPARRLRERHRRPALAQVVRRRLVQLGAAGRHRRRRALGSHAGTRPSRCRHQRRGRPAVAQVVRGWQLVGVGGAGRPHHRRAGDDELVSRPARRLRERVRRRLWHKWYDGAWSNWVPLGGIVVDRRGSHAGNRASDVVIRGADDQLWHKWLSAGSWSAGALGRPHHRRAGDDELVSRPARRLRERDRRPALAQDVDGAQWFRRCLLC